ncbi:FAD/NAD(P)-binding protein [Allokutzneria sp. A3M-2-11 16]|uniref:FAD/NAD(P)-binding protein n=1 Tax=Allokutzneria sp. A3M-2-11 16 TaxID=2962043 RepID=UPI0020B8F189|nr:FAD/NAD(P)-binding protein [Allokutzneria sp. A3M-2-11 16]MCP3799394.1 FAD/NAD(P)-binding protein [Allokutzneria sp. A3M-2-11 16]
MSRLAVCIVGAGPRGTSVLERICANYAEVCLPGTGVVVHVVDPFSAGPGSVWRTEQSGHLLMNTVASQVSLFTDESVDCAGPVVSGPSLYDWVRGIDSRALPGALAAEADRLGPDSYPSRSLYGHYLEWVFHRLVATAPDGVAIKVHRSTAVALEDQSDGRQSVRLADGTLLEDLDSVVLALGHCQMAPTEDEAALRGFAVDHALRYVEPSNPADADLSGVMPGEKVALRGLGLNFFDYLALLTEGRGGRFERLRGGLRYVPSGQEPVLYAGSRRGVPHHARGENQKGPAGRHRPRFLTGPQVAQLRDRAQSGQRLTFRGDLWPLIDKEVRTVYYQTLMFTRGDMAAAWAFLRDYVACQRAGTDDDAVLSRYGIDRGQRWDWSGLERPHGDRIFADRAEFGRWLSDYLDRDVAEARLGNVRSPLKAALDVLRDLRNEIRLIVDHGGITASSYRDELARWYTPFNAFLSIGPPLRRIEEMAALVEAGVLRVLGPGMRVVTDSDTPGFLVDATSVLEAPVAVTTLIEARVPDVDLRRAANPLLRSMTAGGQCRAYRMVDEVGGDFDSGGLAVTARPYRLLDAHGSPHERRFAFGVPTEYVHWVTAAGIRPGVGSVTLEDSDAIARTVLALGSVNPSRPSAEPVREGAQL